MEWVSSMPRKTAEHSLSSTVQVLPTDPHTSAASSRLNRSELSRPPSHVDSFVSPKYEIWFLRVCHLILSALYHATKTKTSQMAL
jgi:hypothetical protein